MNILILTLILISNIGFSQDHLTELKFNTKYYNAIDKWVAFPKKATDSTYMYGFIYLDNQAGFTFSYKGDFKIDKKNLKNIPINSDIGSVTYRLQPNTKLVSVLTKDQVSTLNLPKEPEWLYIYKRKSGKVSYLKNVGYHYNHIGVCDLALKPLLKAYKIDPHYNGLEFELSYAYNHLGQYKEAIPILEKAIKNNPNNFYLFKELGFSYVKLNKIKEAEKTYKKGIEIANNNFEKSEMAVNMAQAYFNLKNKKKFNNWAKITKKYAQENSKYVQYIDFFEKNWEKK